MTSDARREEIAAVVAGLEAAIRDINCPVQFSPLLMQARKLLALESAEIARLNHECQLSMEEIARGRARAEAAERARDAAGEAVKMAARKLANEVTALGAFDIEVRQVIGNTNYNVLMERVEECRAALPKHEAEQREVKS